MNRLELRAGRLRLDINPDTGGSIAGLDWIERGENRPIMRRATHRGNVLDASCFPLVPFVNRIRGGSFRFAGRDIRLDPNMAGDPSPLHGQGWLAPWKVGWATDRQAVLRFNHSAGEWPWDYEARQEFALDEQGLTVTLACRNMSPSAMPCGLGQHPYFPCTPSTRIDTDVGCAWTIDERTLPVEQVGATGRYDLKSRSICGQELDNGFGQWSGSATISDPDWPYSLRLSSRDARFFHIYSPPKGGFFAAEPVTHANAALNEPQSSWGELGLRMLQPDEEMSLEVRLDVKPKAG